jgi:hypothetical protein
MAPGGVHAVVLVVAHCLPHICLSLPLEAGNLISAPRVATIAFGPEQTLTLTDRHH